MVSMIDTTRHRASTTCTRLHFAFALCDHSNATCAPIANWTNSAQLGGIPYHSPKLHPGPCNSYCVGMRPRTDTQTQTRVSTIHFALFTTHAKCNNNIHLYSALYWVPRH